MSNPFIATYRVQLNKDFSLNDAAKIVPYLKDLGISHLYLSPIFESTKDSIHGYDICDFTKISAERGGEEAFAELDAVCASYGIYILLDIVPNHMGISGDNPFWIDVLAKGKDSPYWAVFDLRVNENSKIHLPILDKSVEESLSNGDAVIIDHEKYGRIIRIGQRILPFQGNDHEHYTAVQWTEAFDKISYRRFFDITDLVGVRVEDEDVYNLSHGYLFELCKKYTSIVGVRVDHIDGLADPTGYLERLKDNIDNIWIEKILSGEEILPQDWPIQGTTGYEFISRLNNLLVNPQGFQVLQAYWKNHIDAQYDDFKSCVYQSKKQVLEMLFSAELKRLITLSNNFGSAEDAEIFWQGMTLAFDAYRTYAGENPLSNVDQERIKLAALNAQKMIGEQFNAVANIFLPILIDPKTDLQKQIVKEWQQLSGPVMAKGLEDCAHYRYNPLAALNEVGCEVEIVEDGKTHYFEWAQRLTKTHPHCLLATSTHDTKRSEDVRARLYTLADNPQEWIDFYERAVILNAPSKNDINLRPATEYFLYQSIIAIWPIDGVIQDNFIDRICAYMKKSVKEARVETSWLKPNKEYEDKLDKFIRSIFLNNDFIAHVQIFSTKIAEAGAINSLTALTLKILGPGVPDFYQGSERWDFSLVDPDNRRPVRYETVSLPRPNKINWKSGDYKKWHTQRLLKIRKEYDHDIIDMKPLNIMGIDNEQLIAYEWQSLIVICSRYNGRQLPATLDAYIDFEEGHYKNLITDEIYFLKEKSLAKVIFSESSIAILEKQSFN